MRKVTMFTLILGILVLPLWGSAIVDPTNVLSLHLNEASGHMFKDASGHGNNATCSGSTCPKTGFRGEFGAALKFDGTNDFIQVQNPGSGDFSVEAWIFTTANGRSGGQCYEGNGILWSDVGGLMNDWILGTLNNKLCFFTGNPDTSILSTVNLNDGVWHHVAATRALSGTKRIFVDGKLQNQGSTNNSNLNANPIINIGGNTLDGYYFNGLIDEVQIYNVVLTDEDILNHYKRGALRQNAVLDPLGRFAVYTAVLPGCVNARPVFRAITASGTPTGAAKPLVACSLLPEDVLGIDLVRDGATDQYLFSFGGSQVTDSKFVMRIDVLGNVLQGPKEILSAWNTKYEVGATALADGPALQMWSTGYDGWLYRSQIDKQNLLLLSNKKTQWASAGMTGVHYSQTGSRQFMACEQPAEVFRAFGVVKGVWDGTSWRLSPRTDGGHKTGSVSADGLMALSDMGNSPTDVLYAQPLRNNGHPVGVPTVVASKARFGVVDVSNALSSGIRFVLFGIDSKFYLQKIDATTAVTLGRPVLLNP